MLFLTDMCEYEMEGNCPISEVNEMKVMIFNQNRYRISQVILYEVLKENQPRMWHEGKYELLAHFPLNAAKIN